MNPQTGQAVETPRATLAAGAVAAGLAVLVYSGWQYNFVLQWQSPGDVVSQVMSTSTLVMMWVVFAPVVFAVAHRWPLSGRQKLRNGARMAAFAFVFASVRSFVDHSVWLWMEGRSTTWNELTGTAWLLFHSELLATAVLIGLANFLRLERESGLRAAQEPRLRAALTQARLRKLRGDLHPHFLFNALNAVAATVDDDPKAAHGMMRELTELVRTSLEYEDATEVALGRELEFIRRYLAIQRVRLGPALTATISVTDERLLGASTPPLLLQPLVENAILHGASRRRDGGRVLVAISIDAGMLRMQVRDNGPGQVADAIVTRGSVGIPNVRERLQATYGTHHSFTFRRDGEEFVAEIRIPCRWSTP